MLKEIEIDTFNHAACICVFLLLHVVSYRLALTRPHSISQCGHFGM